MAARRRRKRREEVAERQSGRVRMITTEGTEVHGGGKKKPRLPAFGGKDTKGEACLFFQFLQDMPGQVLFDFLMARYRLT